MKQWTLIVLIGAQETFLINLFVFSGFFDEYYIILEKEKY